jgi:hypothetical protein
MSFGRLGACEFSKHLVEGRLDAMHERGLVGKLFIAIVNQHRSIHLEYDEVARTIQSAKAGELEILLPSIP